METKLPEGWREVELKEVSIVDSGQGAPQGEKWFNGKNIFVRAGNLNKLSEGKYVGDYCDKISDLAIKEYRLKKYPAGCVVFPKSGMSIMTNNIAILKYDSYVVNHLVVIQFTEIEDAKFSYYLLKKIKTSTLVKNKSYPSIRISDVQTLKCLWPIMQLRQKIVSILEQAEKAREWRKEADELTDKFLKSVFVEMFLKDKDKFQELTLNAVSTLAMGGTPDTKESSYWNEGDINWMKSGDIKGDFVYSIPNKITKLGFNKSNTTLFPKDTVVIALNGQGKTRGTTSILKVETTSNQSVVGIMIDKNKATSEYLHYNLKMRYNELRNLTGDKDRSGLNLTILRNFKIRIPPLKLQQKFAAVVAQVEGIKERQKQSKQEINGFFNALMQKAFKGELVS